MSAVPDEAIDAYERVFQTTPFDASDPLNRVRDGLAAAAPLLAAQIIRDHAKDLERRINSAARDGGLSFDGLEAIGTVQRLNRLADDLEKTR